MSYTFKKKPPEFMKLMLSFFFSFSILVFDKSDWWSYQKYYIFYQHIL